MAHFRLYVQIKHQLSRFVTGFRSIISPDWLGLFSAPELQTVLSGEACDDVPMRDLRAHTQYYGGFHSNHRVVLWLWDVLENDFTPEERRLFLKVSKISYAAWIQVSNSSFCSSLSPVARNRRCSVLPIWCLRFRFDVSKWLTIRSEN